MSDKLKLIKEDLRPSYKEGSWTEIAKSAITSCPKIKKEREEKILCDRFGIGKKARTLNAIGVEYGLTRERIRQIVANAVKKIQNYCLSQEYKKRVQLIEKYCDKRGGFVSLSELANFFGISDSKETNALFFVTSTSDKIFPLKESQSLKLGWHTKKVKPQDIRDISRNATDEIKVTKKTIGTKIIAEKLRKTAELTESILLATKAVMKDEKGKWGLTSWPHVNPKSIRDKSKHVLRKHGEPLHYSILTRKITEIGTKKVTKQSVHNELIKNEDFVLIGRGIYALSEWGYTPGIIEEVIVEVLEMAGEPLHKKEIVRRVMEKRIVKESTVILNLQKNRFKRVTKAVYTLN